MSRLDELIQELCPDGVKTLTVSDVALKFTDGMHNLPKTITEQNNYPILSAQNINNGTVDKNASKYVTEDVFLKENKRTDVKIGDVLLTIVGAIGRVAVVEESLTALFQRSVCVIKPNNKIIISKYLRYVLESSSVQNYIQLNAHGAAQKGIYLNDVGRIQIPVPPLSVQEEIVRILDTFTLLTAELQAELQARKQQYAYYQEKLLSDATDAPIKRLGDTCLMKSGKAISASELSTVSDSKHEYPCYGGNGIRGYIAKTSHYGEFPIIGRQGALCGNVNYAIGDFYATEHAVVVKSRGEYDQRYLFYLLTSMNLNQYKSQGAQPGLAVGNIENLEAPVPSLDKQKKIVQVLDRFDSLCTDISTGLPAEISARQKQYEYYRDKLLTFKELDVSE